MARHPLLSTLFLLGLMTFALAACADKDSAPAPGTFPEPSGPGATAAPEVVPDAGDAGAIGTTEESIEGADRDLGP